MKAAAPYVYVGVGVLIVAVVVGLLGWDLYQNIKHTPRRKR